MQYVRGPFPPKFRAAAGSVVLVVCAMAAGPASAQAIYKWVDERGVVNYANTEVPKNMTVSLVDTSPPVVQSDARLAANAARSGRLSDADLLREQLARSQDEIARLRQTSAAGGAGTTPREGVETFGSWRARCENERRNDCDEETYNAEMRLDPVLRQPAVAATPKPLTVRPKPVSMEVAGAPKPALKSGTKPVTSLQ